MRENLATLPWVETGTIQTDAKKRQAKFTVKKDGKFDLEEVKKALTPRYADRVTVLAGPTLAEKG